MPSLRRQTGPLIVLLAAIAATVVFGQAAPLPNRPGSLKFAAIGDNGTGDRPQYDVGAADGDAHATFAFDLVIMLGDNMYGGQAPPDFVKKFEQPYAPLLAAGVKFQASLGNHDRPENVCYKLYNMNGQRYYTYARNNVRFFALDSTQMDPKQVEWLEGALRDAQEDWKICYFHHPLYSERGAPRLVGRPARAARADLHQVRRQRRLLRPRPRLRAHQAAEGHLLLRVGLGGTAAKGQHGIRRTRPPRISIRIRASCSWRSPATRCSSR